MVAAKQFSQVIKIGERLVGREYPTYFIADIGANFDGNLEKAKKLILAAKEAGADVAKFQSFLADKIVSGPSFAKMRLKGVHGTWGKPVNEVFKDVEFPRQWHKKLMKYCRSIGVTFASAPYDFEAVDLLDEIGVDFFKIGSGDITWLEMIEYIARKQKPIILSTGDSTLAEVDEAVRIIESTGNRDLILLQCITNYPSKIESANINVLKTYQTAFNVITGYSDHSPGDVVVLGSVALGGRVIEKHLTLNKQDRGPDHPHSMEPQEFKQMVERVRALERAMGTTRKYVVEEEQETVVVQRRSLHMARNIKKGEILTENDLIVLRPAVGLSPKHKKIIIGRAVATNINKHEAVSWNCLA